MLELSTPSSGSGVLSAGEEELEEGPAGDDAEETKQMSVYLDREEQGKDRMTARAGCLLSREKLELRERNQRDWENPQSCQVAHEQMRPFLAGASGCRAAVCTGAGDCLWCHMELRDPLSAHPACWPRRGIRKEKGKSCLCLRLVVVDK